MKISNLKISTCLALAFAIVLSLSILMTAVGIFQLDALNRSTTEMEESSMRERLAAEWSAGVNANSVRTFARAKTASAEDEKRFQVEMDAQSALVSTSQKNLEERVKSVEGKRRMAVVAERRTAYADIRKKVFETKKAMKPSDGSCQRSCRVTSSSKFQ